MSRDDLVERKQRNVFNFTTVSEQHEVRLVGRGLRFGSPSTIIIPRSFVTQRDAISSLPESSSLSPRIPPWIIPLIHSYSNDIAGVVRIRSVKGGSNLRTSRGSKGVRVANYNKKSTAVLVKNFGVPTSLINLMAIQLLPPSTSSSNSRGASGRKSLGRLHPSSHTTLTMAAVTLGSSSGDIRRSLICGHAALSVSGYTRANLYKVTIVFFRIEGLLEVSRGKRSDSVESAREGFMT